MRHCSNCGAELPENYNFCPACGAAGQPAGILEEPVEIDASFGNLWRTYLVNPFDKFRDALATAKQPGLSALYVSLIGMATFIIVLYISILSMSGRGNLEFDIVWRFVFIIAIVTVFIALFLLLVKAIVQEPLNFGRDLLSASFAVASILFMYSLLFLISLLSSSGRSVGLDPVRSIVGSYSRGGGIQIMFNISIILLFFFKTVNCIIQGLRNSKIKDVTAYYLAPFILCFGIYLGAYLSIEILK